MQVEWTQGRPTQEGRYWFASDIRPCPINLVIVYNAPPPFGKGLRVMWDGCNELLSESYFDDWWFAPAEIPDGPWKQYDVTDTRKGKR